MTELARRRAPAKMSEPARRTGEAVLGWVGVAVGRTIWWDRLEEWLGGASAPGRRRWDWRELPPSPRGVHALVGAAMSWDHWTRGTDVEPSIYAGDFSRLGKQLSALLDAGARRRLPLARGERNRCARMRNDSEVV